MRKGERRGRGQGRQGLRVCHFKGECWGARVSRSCLSSRRAVVVVVVVVVVMVVMVVAEASDSHLCHHNVFLFWLRNIC